VEHGGRITHAPGDGARRIERFGERDDSVVAQRSLAWPVAHHAAESRWRPHRSRRVSTNRRNTHARCHRRRRTRRRASSDAAAIPWILRRSECADDPTAAEGKLVEIGLPDYHG